MDVGVHELKAKLSEYIAAAVAGEDVVVTDRGRPVARLVPVASGSDIERSTAESWIDPPRLTRLQPVDRHRSDVSILDVLDDDRR